MSRNQKHYEIAVEFFTENGVPPSTAERAADVVAKDNPNQPNLGRTEEDQKTVNDAMTWMNAEKISLSS